MKLTVTQNVNTYNITVTQNSTIVKLQPIINQAGSSSTISEIDPVFMASEAYLFETGDKLKLDNQSGINTGDETTLSIQLKRPLKTINSNSIEGIGNLVIDTSGKLNEDISTYTNIILPLISTDEILINRSGVWYKVDKSEIGGVNIQTTVTGTPTIGTTETISQSILIPANTVSLGIYDVLARSFKNNTLGNATNRLYINSSVSLVGAFQLGVGTTSDAGRRSNPIQRFLDVKVLDGTGRGTVVQNLANVVNAYNYDSVGPQDLAINWTIDQYIIHTVQNTNGTETSVSEYIKIRE